jgi:hypothetical protein
MRAPLACAWSTSRIGPRRSMSSSGSSTRSASNSVSASNGVSSPRYRRPPRFATLSTASGTSTRTTRRERTSEINAFTLRPGSCALSESRCGTGACPSRTSRKGCWPTKRAAWLSISVAAASAEAGSAATCRRMKLAALASRPTPSPPSITNAAATACVLLIGPAFRHCQHARPTLSIRVYVSIIPARATQDSRQPGGDRNRATPADGPTCRREADSHRGELGCESRGDGRRVEAPSGRGLTRRWEPPARGAGRPGRPT